MTFGFAAAFLAGIGLAVIAMIAGVEKRRPGERETAISARWGRPLAASFFVGFGAAGYLFARFSELSPPALFVGAAVAGAAMTGIAVLVISRWAIPAARREVTDERYEHQGQIAQVTAAIRNGTTGTIVYTLDGISRQAQARSLDGAPLPAGTEVVIERIEDGIAWVERWEQVERRL